MKHFALAGGLVVVGLAIGVYRAKLGAEETEARIDKLRAQVEQVEHDISVLKAEEAYLARPDRIGSLAQNKLGLAPALPSQFVVSDTLRQRIGEERIIAADPAAAPAREGVNQE